ncbi:hypothetical protein ACQPZF_23850 [Actinosynnema sp. CS-041913]|uniref:hypothetical protein n=1 Tax=Actinosynnema sp. CS-041913 TaxID=3239917 RepID=UPI003D902D62
MSRWSVVAGAAVASLAAGLLLTAPANAVGSTSLPSRLYGCARGDFCSYSTEVISAGTKISIGRGEDWSVSKVADSPYRNVRSFFNYGYPDTEPKVRVTYVLPTGAKSSMCVGPAKDGNVGAGHELPGVPVTVIKIDWRSSC